MGFIEIVRRDARKASMTRVIRLVCEEIMVARPISNTHIPHIKIIRRLFFESLLDYFFDSYAERSHVLSEIIFTILKKSFL